MYIDQPDGASSIW